MADFGANANSLSAPQGAGTDPVQAVQEKVGPGGLSPIISEIGSIFVNGLKNNAAADAKARENAIVGEYVNNEKVYSDALTTGQWNSSQTSVASRANFTKMIAAYPEYVEKITQARAAVYGGTEVGEAQKKIEAEQKTREANIQSASGMGYVFYSGMSDAAKDAQLDAWSTVRRIDTQTDRDMKAAAESRAQAGEQRAGTTFNMSVDDHVAKENAANGAREIAAKNFDTITASLSDLKSKPYDEAIMIHNQNISRINAGLLSIAGKNPELAAPWIKMFGDIDANIKEQLDPKVKSANERKLLEDQYANLLTKQKLAAVTDPALLKAVTATALFPGQALVDVANSPAIGKYLMAGTGTDPKLGTPAQVVGTADDNKAFAAVKNAVGRLQSGGVAEADKPKAIQEATNLVNNLLKQTTTTDGAMNPAALKSASSFFASTEFGKMALAGQVDKQTAANAQHVFQVQYEPAVKQAIISRLEDIGVTGSVDVKVVGGQVTFQKKVTEDNRTYMQQLAGAFNIDKGMAGIDRNASVAGVKEAQDGLNQLIRLHAHLEGTTDYAKYWEDHKHMLMPSIFPDPAKLKPGQVTNGYKYTGGNYRDSSNWIKQSGD